MDLRRPHFVVPGGIKHHSESGRFGVRRLLVLDQGGSSMPLPHSAE